MSHRVAETLDICMEKLFIYLLKYKTAKLVEAMQIFKILLNAFNDIILPSHNTHHVQFLIFYFCSFKVY